MKHLSVIGSLALATIAVGLLASCEASDNLGSRIACSQYCDKDYDCQDVAPSTDEYSSCVSSCRNAIEDNCGNDYQDAANHKIYECVDKSCTDFHVCMVFEAAPECFAFTD
jgi:hypothetical protein